MSSPELPRLQRRLESESGLSKLLKTLLLLGLVGLVAVAISWAFGWVAIEEPSREELIAQIREGRKDMRRAAALEWSRRLGGLEMRGRTEELEALRPSGEESRQLAMAWSNSEEKDPAYLAGLAQVLSFTRDEALASQSLCDRLGRGPEATPLEAQLFAILALGRLARSEAGALCPPLFERAQSSEPSLRKTVAFALGLAAQNSQLQSGKNQITAVLGGLHLDGTEDVRWNAAFAAAHWGDALGRSTLALLLDRALKLGADGEEPLTEFLLHAVQSALTASLELPDPDLHGKVEKLAEGAPSLTVRQAARRALASRAAP